MGNLFGGQAMAWMEMAGFIAATRHARLPVHVISVDYIHFYKPAFVGDRVNVRAVVTYAFPNNTIEVMVHLQRQKLVENSDDLNLKAFFIYSTSDTQILPILPTKEYANEHERAFGREKIRLKRQILRNPTGTIAVKWGKDYKHELFVRQLILKNIEALLKLNERSHSWTVYKQTDDYSLATSVLSNNITGISIFGTIQQDTEIVFKIMMDPEKRPLWDKMFRGGSVLEQIDARNCVVRMLWKPVKSEHVQDMILLRSWKKKYAGKEYVIANISIDYPNAPSDPNVSRSEILASGYILERLGPKLTRIISLFQFGGKALTLALGDLVDSHGDLTQAAINLKNIAESEV